MITEGYGWVIFRLKNKNKRKRATPYGIFGGTRKPTKRNFVSAMFGLDFTSQQRYDLYIGKEVILEDGSIFIFKKEKIITEIY